MTDQEQNALDAHALAEKYAWQSANYERAVRRFIDVVVDAIQRGAKEALDRPINYDPDLRHERTFIDQAAEIEHVILQAVNNADFRGLTRTAGDVHATAQAMALLERFKATLPEGFREALEERETSALQERIDERKARIAELDERDAKNCRASVHESGRGVGFYRCQKTGKVDVVVDGRPGYLGKIVEPDDENAITIKVCGTHARDIPRGKIHVWTPSEWEEREALRYRAKTTRELEAMEARLPRQLTEGGNDG